MGQESLRTSKRPTERNLRKAGLGCNWHAMGRNMPTCVTAHVHEGWLVNANQCALKKRERLSEANILGVLDLTILRTELSPLNSSCVEELTLSISAQACGDRVCEEVIKLK